MLGCVTVMTGMEEYSSNSIEHKMATQKYVISSMPLDCIFRMSGESAFHGV